MSGKTEKPVDPAEARALAFRFLGRREYGCRELALKLERRGVDPATAASVILDLETEGLVSDERFAEVFVRSRVARLFGPLKIRAQLQQRGIAASVIQATLGEYQDQWGLLARTWVEKKAAQPLDRKGMARLYRGGKSRGFTHDQIMRALDTYRPES